VIQCNVVLTLLLPDYIPAILCALFDAGYTVRPFDTTVKTVAAVQGRHAAEIRGLNLAGKQMTIDTAEADVLAALGKAKALFYSVTLVHFEMGSTYARWVPGNVVLPAKPAEAAAT